MDRVVILIDMDCFYVQVEQRRNPTLKGKPAAVVQYNSWKGGAIIAVSYEARAFGVTRQMRGAEARGKCPAIQLVTVPENRGKADLTRYREAGAEVITVLCKYSDSVERASVDEAYVDVTDQVQTRLAQMEDQGQVLDPEQLHQTFIAGHDVAEEGVDIEDVRKRGLETWLTSSDLATKRLGVGALIAEEMRAAVFKDTGFRCSAGISHNKMLAKIACGFHKPNRQSVLPPEGLDKVYKTIPIRKFRNLGGKLGHSISEDLGVEYMGDLLRYTEKQLQKRYSEKTGTWLYSICRGIDDEPVRPRQLAKSTGCSKTFPGKNALDTRDKVKHWFRSLAEEVEHRLLREEETNNRTAKHLTVSVGQAGKPLMTTASRSCAIHQISSEKIAKDCFSVIQNLNHAGNHQAAWSPAITYLGISASKFVEGGSSKLGSIQSFLSSGPSKPATALLKEDQQEGLGPEMAQDQTSRRTLDRFLTQPSKEPKQETVDQQTGAGSSREPQERRKSSPKDQGIRTFFSQRKSYDDTIDPKGSASHSVASHPSTVASVERDKGDVRQESNATEDLLRMAQDGSGNAEPQRAGLGQSQSFFARLQQKKDREIQDKKSQTLRLGQSSTTAAAVGHLASRLETNVTENGAGALDHIEEEVDGDVNLFPEMSSDEDFEDSRASSSKGRGSPSCASEHTSGHHVSDETGKEKQKIAKKLGQHKDSTPVEAGPSRVPGEDEILCEKCQQIISVWDYPEHLDFHVALELQEQDRAEAKNTGPRPGQSNTTNGNKPKSAPTIKVGKKRGRPPGSTTKNKKTKQGGEAQGSGPGSSSLHSFFKPK
ncbi:DNA polymerase eta [Strongylocentrotus purpuratus]|uniref:DNA polymerase eta n=1 Tax=Strongylocentrotus purpuratus TaxID=7668 RepID=A0A7M7PTE4_STRPU|nr:DNA polymerase eta [Strongylocentrotus purpuratus]